MNALAVDRHRRIRVVVVVASSTAIAPCLLGGGMVMLLLRHAEGTPSPLCHDKETKGVVSTSEAMNCQYQGSRVKKEEAKRAREVRDG